MYDVATEGTTLCMCTFASRETAGAHLLAITSPSRGVTPMVVSTDCPFLMQHIDDPAPRWQAIRLTSETSLPR